MITSLPVTPVRSFPRSSQRATGGTCHDRRAKAADPAVHVRVPVRRDAERIRPRIAFFDHDLMADAAPCRIKVDPVLLGKRFDLAVLGEIIRRRILNVVIQCEHRLARIGNLLRADALELGNDRAGVVMRHHVRGTDREIIPRPHNVSAFQINGKLLSNLFNEVLRHEDSVFEM